MPWLLLAGLALAPLLPLWRVSAQESIRVRDLALIGAPGSEVPAHVFS